MKLKSRLPDAGDSEIEGLNSLISIEISLLSLNGLLILLFFGGSTYFLQPLRMSITLIQYWKIYLLISLFASFKTVWNRQDDFRLLATTSSLKYKINYFISQKKTTCEGFWKEMYPTYRYPGPLFLIEYDDAGLLISQGKIKLVFVFLMRTTVA